MTDLIDATTPQPITTKDHLLQRLKEGFHEHQQGEMEAAKACYQEVLEIQPDQFDALQLMGVLLAQSGEPSRAIDYFQKALELDPLNVSLNANCARAYMDLGYWSDALARYAAIIESAPHLSDGHKGWAECQIHLGGVEDAIAGFKSAIDLRHDDHDSYASLSKIFFNANDFEQGLAFLDRAIEIAPKEANYHVNRGLLLSKLNRSVEAMTAVDRALQIDPQNVNSWTTKECLEIDFYRTEEALRSFDEAIRIEPNNREAIDNKVSYLYTAGRLAEAIKTARSGFYNTRDMKYLSMTLFISGHLLGIDEQKHFSEICEFENELITVRPHDTSSPHASGLERRIKIGFISGDFMWHVVSDLVGPVISSINREEFEVFAYYNNDVEDVMTAHLKSKVNAWRQVEKLTDDDFAALIKRDEIDILIDLSGHTGRNRLPVLARKAAPIQVTWIGDPNTTGLSTVDYVLTDAHLSPYGLYEHYWTEHFVRVPAAATLDWVAASDYTSLKLPALERGYVLFASFNRPSKLNDEVIKTWSTILKNVPNSKLLVGATPDFMHKYLLNWFSAWGIKSHRLIFKPHLGRNDYIKQFSEIDILLDSWPYTGGGSTAVALAYGAVPIVTMAGNSMRHMQGAWLMQHLKLTDWVAYSVDDYIAIATSKALDLNALAKIREEMPERWRSSALGNPSEVTKHIEKALSTMWQRYCLGKKPESFDIVPPHTDENDPI